MNQEITKQMDIVRAFLTKHDPAEVSDVQEVCKSVGMSPLRTSIAIRKLSRHERDGKIFKVSPSNPCYND